jgi:hypothetical protein
MVQCAVRSMPQAQGQPPAFSQAFGVSEPTGRHAAASTAAHPFVRRHDSPYGIQELLCLVVFLLTVVCQLKHDGNNGRAAAGATACRKKLPPHRSAHGPPSAQEQLFGWVPSWSPGACRMMPCADCCVMQAGCCVQGLPPVC